MFKQESLFPDIQQGETKPSPERANGRRRQACPLLVQGEQTWLVQKLQEILQRVGALETAIDELANATLETTPEKESYSTKEVAKILGKRPYTVREWCRNRRVNAYKPGCGRGAEEEWRITHEELTRIQNDGLLPPPERF